MTYRSYPDADRARHQLNRHRRRATPAAVVSPTVALLAAGLKVAAMPNWDRVVENLRAAGRALAQPATRPGPGSGR